MDITTKPVFKILPNPYMDKININFESKETGKVEVRMINTSGNVIKAIESTVTTGNNNLQLQDLYSQAAGIYVINIAVNGKAINSQKIVKL